MVHFFFAENLFLELGESPIWVDHLRKFYFVDIKNPKIYSYQLSESKLETFTIPFTSSCIVNTRKNLFLLASGNKIYKTNSEFQEFFELCTINQKYVGTRLNDGSYDGLGNLWVSGIQSNDRNLSSIFKISSDKKIEIFEKNNIKLGNGIDWSVDKKKMYLNDSKAKTTYIFDFDTTNSRLSNKKKFFDFKDFPGEPDGLTVDDNGVLWIPIWDQGLVTTISQNGRLLNCFDFPALRPTSIAFANDNKNTMLITTAKSDSRQSSDDGSVFLVTNT